LEYVWDLWVNVQSLESVRLSRRKADRREGVPNVEESRGWRLSIHRLILSYDPVLYESIP
jgi:hypothetical protein